MDARRPLIASIVAAVVLLAIAFVPAPAASPAIEAGPPCLPARPHASGTTVETIATAEGLRTYRLHVPPSYSGAEPLPLVLNFHGATGSAAGQEWYSGLSAKGDTDNFVVIYPQGSLLGWGFTHFNALQLPPPEPDDVAFVSAVLDEVEAELCIETARVYATGFSNGAWMAGRLACSLSGRIAAIAFVAGAYYPPLDEYINAGETCPDTRLLPVLAFHGTDDASIPFSGGSNGWLTFRLPIDSLADLDVMESWATHNSCAGGRQVLSPSATVHVVSYGDCANGAQVRLYVLDGAPHLWPVASGPHGISATEIMWEFFEDYTLAGPVQTDLDGDTVGDAFDHDDDGDSCLDVMELRHGRNSEATGGRRDPDNAWDYFDTDGSGVVALDDIFNVALRFGADADTTGFGEPDGYDPALDRSDPPPGAPLWETGPPDGTIDLSTDIFAVAVQYGHECP